MEIQIIPCLISVIQFLVVVVLWVRLSNTSFFRVRLKKKSVWRFKMGDYVQLKDNSFQYHVCDNTDVIQFVKRYKPINATISIRRDYVRIEKVFYETRIRLRWKVRYSFVDGINGTERLYILSSNQNHIICVDEQSLKKKRCYIK